MFLSLPVYLLQEEGPDHAKRFFARAEVDGRVWGQGEGRSKKQAEQAAAREAYRRLLDVEGGLAPDGELGGDGTADVPARTDA